MGFMTSPEHFGDFTAPERYPAGLCFAGKQELFTHHFASLFPILKVNIYSISLKENIPVKKT